MIRVVLAEANLNWLFQANLPPPSPVVMRYWKQCSSTADSGYFGEEGLEAEEHARGERRIRSNLFFAHFQRVIHTRPVKYIN